MQIFSIPFTNNKQITSKKEPSFKKLDSFATIKQIEGITCACCGEKVLSANKYAETITKISKSLHIVMRKGHLNFVKSLFPESWKLLINFTYKYPNKSLDEIMENSLEYTALKKTVVAKLDRPDLEHQTIERLKVDREITKTFFNILASGRSEMKESSIVMDTISSLKPLLNNEKKEVFELFENYSKIYPDKTLTEIVNEVYEVHAKRGKEFKENNLKLINEKFEAIKNIANNSNVNITEDLDIAQEKIMSMYYDSEDGIKYKSYDIRGMYNKILKKKRCNFLYHFIMKQIKELPPSLENVDTFIIKAHDYKYTDSRILLNIFRSIFSSEEKIVSLDNNGANKIGNKIVMCNHCVKIRENSFFDVFTKKHPEFAGNAQKQMNIIMNEILAKNLDGNFRFYPLVIAHKFKELSKGSINLDLKNYCEEILKDSDLKLQEIYKNIERYQISLLEIKESIIKFPKLEADFIRETNRINSKLNKLQTQIETEKSLQSHINKYLETSNIENNA